MKPILPFARHSLALAMAFAPLAALPTAAAAADGAPAPATISVSAEGSATAAPDMAVIQLTVLREAETARAALDANSDAMGKVLAAFKEAGIADRDLQTSDFSIQPRWIYPNDANKIGEPRIVGYQVSNGLSVRVRDLSKLGAMLDTAVTLGVNQGGGITFTNDDPQAAISAARKQAVEKALKKARELTEAAGVGLGRITSISEQNYESPPVPMARAAMMKAEAADAVPVAAGENQYRVSVSMSWEIAQ